MIYSLSYRKGSFPQSEDYSSLSGAMGRAAIVLETNGCFGLAIEEGGVHMLQHSEIVRRLASVVALLPGRSPLFRA